MELGAMPDPCPCGTRPKTTSKTVEYVTQAVLDVIQATSVQNLTSVLDPVYGRAFKVSALCAAPPPPPPTVSVDWFTDPLSHVDDIWLAVQRIEWNTWCECIPCPPIAGCAGANSFTLGPGDGYCHDMETIGGVDVCVQEEYRLAGGQTCYVKRDSDGHCFGPFSGLVVDWIINSTFDPNLNVVLASNGGGGATGWHGATLGQNMTVYVGDGTAAGPSWIWDNGTITLGPEPVPAACDPTTVCTAVQFLYDQIVRLQSSVQWLGYVVGGTASTGDFPIPGTINNANGSLMDVIRQAVTALAPMTATQLVNATTTPVAGSTTFSVVGKQFVEIAFTALDPSFGARGTTAPVFYSAARYPGPGWVLVCSDYGVMEYHELKYPQNTQIQLPPLATHLLIELNALVEVNVTTFERDVSL